MSRLILAGITHPGSYELSDGLISLGRNPTNDIRVHDPTVSSFHCELVITGENVVVRDLNSTNGTFVDDAQVQEAALRPWQKLRLGHAEMRLEVGADVADGIDISIPQPVIPKTDPVLLDGRLACENHPGTEAAYRCSSCGKTFCLDCVPTLGLKGAEPRRFCPACRQECLPLEQSPRTRKRPSLLNRLTQTIRIRRR